MLTWKPSRFHDALHIGPLARFVIWMLCLIWLAEAVIRIGCVLFVHAPEHPVQEDVSVPFFIEPAQDNASQRQSKRQQSSYE